MRARLIVMAGAVSLLGSVAVLVAGELYLRATEPHVVQQDARSLARRVAQHPEALIYYTKKGKRLRPHSRVLVRNHRLSGRDVVIETNSLGFRDDPITPTKHASEVRVLVLGDSITWGDYLPADQVYVERAEAHLREALPDARIEVVNAGVGDIGIVEEIDILEETGILVEPDVVVLGFYLNDSRPPWGFPRTVFDRGFLRRHSVLVDRIYRALALRRWIAERGDRFAWVRTMHEVPWRTEREAFERLVEDARYDWGAAWRDDSWTVVETQLDRLERLSREHGFRVAVVIFPVSFQASSAVADDRPQEIMAGKAARRGWPVLDLLPVARAHAEDFFFDICHPRAAANDRIGRALADFLVERELVAPPRAATAAAGS